MAFQWLIYLALVAIGFYFGKFFGALALPLLYFYVFSAKRQPNQPRQPQKQTRGNSLDWAYRILGVSPQADDTAIKKARKQLLNKYHPDKLAPDADDYEKQLASDKINEINRAFKAIAQAREQHEK